MDKVLADILTNKQSEIDEVKSSILSLEKKADGLKPSVVIYNEFMKQRKELRRLVRAKEKEMTTVSEFFKGTSIFDERFPLFAQKKVEIEPVADVGVAQ